MLTLLSREKFYRLTYIFMAKFILVNYNLCGEIFGNLSFIELNWNELTQLGRDNARMRVVFVQRFSMSEFEEIINNNERMRPVSGDDQYGTRESMDFFDAHRVVMS